MPFLKQKKININFKSIINYMSTNTQTQIATTEATGVKGLSSFLNSDNIKNKFTEILGQKGVGFISSVLSVVSSNTSLINADRNSIYTAALLAASLDLPINQNLGFAYIVPYNQKQSDGSWKQMAQFQLGYKGFKQLAQRTGQFVFMNTTEVKENEITSRNFLTGEIDFDWNQDIDRHKLKTVGYVSYFELNNGFKSTFYMTTEQIELHAKKYSQTYKKYNTGIWKDDFEGMASKTVTKLNLSKNAPLSIELQRAVIADQSVIKNDNFTSNEVFEIEPEYVDNNENILNIEDVNKNKEKLRIQEHIQKSKTVDELQKCESGISMEDMDLVVMYDDKKRDLTPKK